MSPRYLAQRLLYAVFVLWGVSVVVFMITRISGDPVQLMVEPGATPQEMAALRNALGLDSSLPEQYWRFISQLARGDFGKSLWQGQPSLDLILERVPASLELAAAAIFISIGLGIPMGILAALNKDRSIDRWVIVIALLGQAIPTFWLGLILILLFAVTLHVLPTSGRSTPAHLVLPAVTLAAFFTARTARIVRSSMLEVLSQEYIRTAHAKGLFYNRVIWRHALPNAAIPIITLLGLDIGALLGGAVITETIFGWPGLGRLLVEAIFRRDFPLVQASVLFIAVGIIGINFLVDVAYGLVDPRTRER